MTIEFSLSRKQEMMRDAVRDLAVNVIRPQALAWDRAGGVPEEFLRNMARLATSFGSNALLAGVGEEAKKLATEGDEKPAEEKKKRSDGNLFSAMAAEMLSWGDPGLLLCLPGPGLGGPPVRSSGTPEQRKRFMSIFADIEKPLQWGAYGLTEPGAGSDVAGIRTSCRKDGAHWVLNGRKCYITNGARAAWTVIFATIDPSLGRAGHRAFVVEKGTPGFSVGRIEEKMGLRASETAELVLEDCRVPEENLLGGEEKYTSKEGFMTAMKTFDNTRPLVAAMALGIGRAAYEYARDFVKDNYVLARPIPRYAAIVEKLAKVGRGLEAARVLTWRAAWMADEGISNAKEASMSKAMAGQAAIRACIDAIEICGAEGSIAKDHQLLEKWFRDIKVYDIFEGTGQIQRIVISKRLISDLKSF
ncbi:MAG: acyl-CoA dehydrogenase family protein [Labilithrix sp.]|nr:acyl-CoA dehydrogenase family protein [Labilithrix sp.]MCW5818247.1 acyl-CoA dehydrogenase family protein [Labilithrix sp.]